MCIESLSIDLTRPMLDAAARSVDKLADKIEEKVPSAFLSRGWGILIDNHTPGLRRRMRPSSRMNMPNL